MSSQLTFDILLNSSVRSEDKLRLTGQAGKIYRRLQQGPMTTSELASIDRLYNSRLNEIRHAIVRAGLMIDEIRGKGCENKYEIVPLDVSTFWRKVKQKGEECKWL